MMTVSNYTRPVMLVLILLITTAGIIAQTEPVTNEGNGLPVLRAPESRRYKLNPGDIIEVIYRYTPEFNQTVTVLPDGFVELQIVGEVKLEGLTMAEARDSILNKATERLKDPEITLLLQHFQKPYYVVAGEVIKPGRFEMDEPITALQAVMLAGGFNESSKMSKVVIFRKINKDFAKVMTVDLKGINETSDLENDLNLLSGDIVFIPKNNFSKVERIVRLTSIASILNPFRR